MTYKMLGACDPLSRRASSPHRELSMRHVRALFLQPRVSFVLAVFVLVLFYKDLVLSSLSRLPRNYRAIHSQDEVSDSIANSTLGFQNIYAIVLSDRNDRRAALIETANATNLSITVLDAVYDRDIPEGAFPEIEGPEAWRGFKNGEKGCIMSHMNTWHKMIAENVSSALIIESDADWDMRVRQSMLGLADATPHLLDYPFESKAIEPIARAEHARQFKDHVPPKAITPSSPYGDKWDILWVGNCGSKGNGEGRFYVYNDSAAPLIDHVFQWLPGAPDGYRPPGHNRIVFAPNHVVCTTAYAISNRGARRLSSLYDKTDRPIDLSLWEHCANNPQLVCLSVFPQIFATTPSRSRIVHESGGLPFGGQIEEETVAGGKSIQISARINGHHGIGMDQPQNWIKEWPSEGDKKHEDDKKTEVKVEEETADIQA